MGFNFRACGCPYCEKLARKQEIDEFIQVTSEFRDIIRRSYGPEEEEQVRLLANRLAATIPLPLTSDGDYEWIDSPHPLEPPEGWCSA